jgi:FkbM family methyltransferase
MIFDVGANIGQTATDLLAEYPRSVIHCFEPMSSVFEELRKRLAGTENVGCWNLALGKTSGTVVMTEGDISTTSRVASSSDEYDSWGRAERAQMSTIWAFCEEKRIRKIGLLKIDTEGYDLEVLEGAARMLDSQLIDLVQVEVGMSATNKYHVPFDTMRQFMEGKKYHLFGIYNQALEWPTSEPRLRRSDAVFVSENVVSSMVKLD